MPRALATLDDANLIARAVRELGLTANLFGTYCGLSSGEVCSLLNGMKRLSAVRKKQFDVMIKDLRLVQNAFAPAPIDFRQVDRVKSVISSFSDGSLITGVNFNGSLCLSGGL